MSVEARAGFSGTSVAFPAESAYGQMPHDALEDDGVRVVQLVIPGSIPEVRLKKGIDDVAERIWRLHDAARPFRTIFMPLERGRE